MARDFAKKFYNSKAWKKARLAYIYKKFGLCERCIKPNSKQVHHIKKLTPENIDNPEITLNEDNLEVLCDECHQLEHHQKYSMTEVDLVIDDNGMVVKREG